MAAGEDQLEPLVWDRHVRQFLLAHLVGVEQAGLRGECPLAPDPVDRAVPRGRQEPGPRVSRHPGLGPALGRDRERLRGGLLGEIELTEETDQGGEDMSPLVAEDLLDDPSTP